MIGHAKVKPQPVTVVDTSREGWQVLVILLFRAAVVAVRLLWRAAGPRPPTPSVRTSPG